MSFGSFAPSLAVLFAQETAAPAQPDRWLAMAKHPVGWGVVLAALAIWLMLPRGGKKGRWIGAVIGVIALGCFATQMLGSDDWSGEVVFRILAAVTVVSAVCTVTFRSPVYCAVWFALTLVGSAAIFMLQGAQFLGVATIVVYAGAILVTFLFVLMLAQPRGNAFYDRVSWEALLSAGTGAVMVGVLTITVGKLELAKLVDSPNFPQITAHQREQNVLAAEHVAHLGAELFGRHLIAVEVAGTLLLIALVGATAIVAAVRQSSIAGSKTAGGKEANS
jgi:NADH-quinone oxidoreductase subunit J